MILIVRTRRRVEPLELDELRYIEVSTLDDLLKVVHEYGALEILGLIKEGQTDDGDH
jgi:hypothetical protein